MRGLSLDQADVSLPRGARGRRRRAIRQFGGADLLAGQSIGDQFFDDLSVLAVRCAEIKLDQPVHFLSAAERGAAQPIDGRVTEFCAASDFGTARNSNGRPVSSFPLARWRLVALNDAFDLGDRDRLARLCAFDDFGLRRFGGRRCGEQVERGDWQFEMFQLGTLLVDLDEAPGALGRQLQLTIEPRAPASVFFEEAAALGKPAADFDHALDRLLAERADRGGMLSEGRDRENCHFALLWKEAAPPRAFAREGRLIAYATTQANASHTAVTPMCAPRPRGPSAKRLAKPQRWHQPAHSPSRLRSALAAAARRPA